ncbi:hypothetical protein [Streptomyces sp. cg2]|uniref:hypothetical protein n=1 Tax=Streptomyces sp. cg2 TaxID=3238799 RepID=UPI0034E29416
MEISDFAQREAGLIRAALTDEEWAELLQQRPSLEAALAARQRTLSDVPIAEAFTEKSP